MYQVIDQLAKDQYRAVGLAEQCLERRKGVLRFRCPEVELLPDFGEVRERVPREVRVPLDAAGCEVAIC